MPPAYLIKPFSKKEIFISIEIALSNFSINENKSKTSKNKISQSHVIKMHFL